MTTERQKAAVRYCESWLPNVSFRSFCEAWFGDWKEGYIDNFRVVSAFLSRHLDDAKEIDAEASAEYQSWLWEKGY